MCLLFVACNPITDFGPHRHSTPKLESASSFDYENQQFAAYQSTANNQLDDVTNEKATLGRVLFYDTQLSINNAISCGSCHKQGKAFADQGAFSTGFRGVKTTRNSPPTFNAGLNGSLFWDSRASSLNQQVLMPAFDHVEMGLRSMDDLIQKLNAIDYYQPLFQAAYPSVSSGSRITEENVRESIELFIRSMISFNSEYDKRAEVTPTDEIIGLSAMENLGGTLFFGKARCSSCHSGANFGTWGNSNIGLEMNYTDPGLASWAGEGAEGIFKIPTLRNLVFTAPYMHDGRFQTLEEVVEHYNSGIAAHPNLDTRLWQVSPTWEFDPFGNIEPVFPDNGGEIVPVRLDLTDSEKNALVAFLKTLTDFDLVNDPKFSDPFYYED
jgi:cytochrome c peroxidase